MIEEEEVIERGLNSVGRGLTSIANAIEALAEASEEGQKGMANSIKTLAGAVYPPGVLAGRDASGGTVTSLSEAVMGINAGLEKVAAAIEYLAYVVRDQ